MAKERFERHKQPWNGDGRFCCQACMGGNGHGARSEWESPPDAPRGPTARSPLPHRPPRASCLPPAAASPFGQTPAASPFGGSAPAPAPFGGSAFGSPSTLGAGAAGTSAFGSTSSLGAGAAPAFGSASSLGGAPAFGSASALGTPGFGAAGGDARSKVVEIYQKCNPTKLGEVDKLLAKYAGREAELVLRLQKKYAAQLGGGGNIPAPQLRAFFQAQTSGDGTGGDVAHDIFVGAHHVGHLEQRVVFQVDLN